MVGLCKRSLILAFTVWFCFPASGQTGALPGDYELVGRRCENNSRDLIPPDGDTTQEMFFGGNGSFRGTYFSQKGSFDEEEYREVRERRQRDERARALEFFEEDKERHEAACREHGEMLSETNEDMCSSQFKKRLYEKWRRDRVKEAERWLKEEEEREEKELADIPRGPCSMEHNGRYTAQGNRLTIFTGDFKASASCGADSSLPSEINMTYYFEKNGQTLYLVTEPNEDSREHCGNSNWAFIFSRK